MNETLRLYPVVPFNVRMSLHDTTLPRGGGPDGMSPIGVLKDTPIGYSSLILQRREDPFQWRTTDMHWATVRSDRDGLYHCEIITKI
jgi:hypothetical protein